MIRFSAARVVICMEPHAETRHATMTTNFARHEQFLRIWKLLEHLEASRRPVADSDLVDHLKESLGLTSLSPRTLGRDCEFLASCGYPIERQTLPESRKNGWHLQRQAGDGKRWMPREPLTLLEVTAFLLSREHMRFAEGTVLWTGIESLWAKIVDTLPEPLAEQVSVMAAAWHVDVQPKPAYADRPRLLSLLCAAVTSYSEVEISLTRPEGKSRSASSATSPADEPLTADTEECWRISFLPHGLAVSGSSIGLVGFPADATDGRPLLIDLAEIVDAVPADKRFEPCGEPVRELVSRAVRTNGRPV